MKKPKHYFCETWQQSFWLMVGWKPDEAQKWLKKMGWDTGSPFHCGKTIFDTDGVGPIIIWTNDNLQKGRREAVLAHECLHAAHICLDRVGVKADFRNDEAEAYLMTNLIRQALE